MILKKILLQSKKSNKLKKIVRKQQIKNNFNTKQKNLQNYSLLTYPSGCNLMRKRLRLKDSLRILAQEKVLIFV